MNDPNWKPLDTTELRERLAHVRDLLRQAAAVGLAQDVERLETLSTLTETEETRVHGNRRRYR